MVPFVAVNDGCQNEHNIIPLSWWQDTIERDLYCRDCGFKTRVALPQTYPAHRVECAGCWQMGFVIF
jgi:hypothetical protein